MGNLLYLVALVMVIAWAIGFFSFHAGELIHVLLIIAAIAIIMRLLEGKKSI